MQRPRKQGELRKQAPALRTKSPYVPSLSRLLGFRLRQAAPCEAVSSQLREVEKKKGRRPDLPFL